MNRAQLYSQSGNLIFNGDFEQWDTAKYSQADLGDTRLCVRFDNRLLNESVGAWSLKNLDCVRWLKYWYNPSFILKYQGQMSPGGTLPAAYKVCYKLQYINGYSDTNLPIKGSTTFIGLSTSYDTNRKAYSGGKHFLNMRLIEPLKKGKTYKFDFDIKTPETGNTNCPNLPVRNGTTGFGFGFTVDTPDYIQNPNTYETDLVPKFKIGYFNDKIWNSISFSFVADSAYEFLVFGFFDPLTIAVDSNYLNCTYQNGQEKYASYFLDNLYLSEINNDFLPNDTSVCIGDSILIRTKNNRVLKLTVNSTSIKENELSLKILDSEITVIASDSFVSDTMNIYGRAYPVFTLSHQDTMCDQRNTFNSTPSNIKYRWLPEGYVGSSTMLIGGKPRKLIGTSEYGCSDTIDFSPYVSDDTCEINGYFIPTAFTPNNDNSNDVFKVYGENIRSVHLQIFNLWGEKLLDKEGVSPEWDGSYMNHLCPQGTYIFYLEITNLGNKKSYVKGVLQLLE